MPIGFPAHALWASLLLGHATGAVPARVSGPAAPVIVAPGRGMHQAPEGHVQLRWRPAGTAAGRSLRFELQQATNPRFANAKVRYLGPDRACFLSGLPEGTFHFRVRALDPDGLKGPWSKPRIVQVRYVSRRVVAVLMALGFLVLGATLAVILYGHRRTRALPDARAGARDEDEGTAS